MSINLVAVDLTSASTGTNGIVKLPFPAVQEGELAHLRVYNESGCGLTILFDNGHQEVIPAGAWPMFEIEPVVRQYIWTVTYVLPNAPVALLSAVYYFPYEGVPPTPALGNSPIGVTGGVTTSSVQTLSNETSVLGTKIIDIGTLTIGDLLDIFNDHFLWSVQQAGVAHQVLKGQTTGNPLQIGQTGDTSEVLGTLAVDQNVKTNSIRDNTNGNLCIDLSAGTGAVVLSLAGLLTHIQGTLTVDQTALITGILTAVSAIINTINSQAATNLALNVPTGQKISAQVNTVEQAFFDATGLTFASGKKMSNPAGANFDIDIADTTKFIRLLNNGVDVLDATNLGPRLGSNMTLRLLIGSLSSAKWGAFSPGSGITTITHNFGFVPDVALWSGGNIANSNPGTTTASIYNVLANTCTINNFAAVNGYLVYLKA